MYDNIQPISIDVNILTLTHSCIFDTSIWWYFTFTKDIFQHDAATFTFRSCRFILSNTFDYTHLFSLEKETISWSPPSLLPPALSFIEVVGRWCRETISLIQFTYGCHGTPLSWALMSSVCGALCSLLAHGQDLSMGTPSLFRCFDGCGSTLWLHVCETSACAYSVFVSDRDIITVS